MQNLHLFFVYVKAQKNLCSRIKNLRFSWIPNKEEVEILYSYRKTSLGKSCEIFCPQEKIPLSVFSINHKEPIWVVCKKIRQIWRNKSNMLSKVVSGIGTFLIKLSKNSICKWHWIENTIQVIVSPYHHQERSGIWIFQYQPSFSIMIRHLKIQISMKVIVQQEFRFSFELQ